MSNIAIRYCTVTGHSRQLAEAIAAALGLEAKDISAGLDEPVDQLFLCNGLYAASLDKRLKTFLEVHGKDAGEIINVSSSATGRSARKSKRVPATGRFSTGIFPSSTSRYASAFI